MQTYYAGAGGGCFGPDATVVRVGPDGGLPTAIPITALHRGDLVLLAGGGYGAVVCIVRIARSAAKPLLRLDGSGLVVTPKHPVRVGGKWTIPAKLPATAVPHNGFVYTVVVDSGHVVLVDGVECVTWGHGLADEAVAHSFYGSLRRVVENLSRLPGWTVGQVEVDGCIRAAKDGRVEGLVCSRRTICSRRTTAAETEPTTAASERALVKFQFAAVPMPVSATAG